jgi:hypothetical protein
VCRRTTSTAPDPESCGGLWRRLRRRHAGPILTERAARKLARRLPVTDPFDLDALLGQAEKIAGVPIVVRPFLDHIVSAWRAAGESLPAAMCVASASSIYVFYRQDTSPAHQRHSILHEFGHICARHVIASSEVVDSDNLNTETVREATHRSLYEDGQERAAEAFAYALEKRMGPMRVLGDQRSADPSHQEAVYRYGSILEG